MGKTAAFAVLFLAAWASTAQAPEPLSPEVKKFIRVQAPVIALNHIRVIDGTGSVPLEDQTAVIADGKIQAMGTTGKLAVPAGAQVLDLSGYSVIPGIVGMHEHMFYPRCTS